MQVGQTDAQSLALLQAADRARWGCLLMRNPPSESGTEPGEPTIKAGDELIGTVTEVRRSALRLDVGGQLVTLPALRLGLPEGGVEGGPHKLGDRMIVQVETVHDDDTLTCAPLIKVGDELLGTIKELRPDSLGLDVEGRRGWILADNLRLRAGEVEAVPYKQGHVLPVQVLGIDRDGVLDCKLVIEVGDVLKGTVTKVRPSLLSVDIKGRRGRVPHDRLGLRAGEVKHGPYQVGHVLPMRVQGVNLHGSFDCELVIKVGDVLEGTVAERRPKSLGVDIKGWRGWVPRGRLGLGQNEAGDGPYRQGNVLRVCVVGINPGQSFDCEPVIEAGDQIDGVVAELRPSSIGLNIHGRRGWVLAHRLGLRPGEVESGPYEPGGRLRVRVLAPNPDESFDCAPCADVGDELLGTITKVTPNGLRLNVDDQLGLIQAGRLGLPDGDVEGGPYEHEGRMLVRVEEVRPNGTLWVTPHIEVGDLLIGRVAEFHPNSLGLDIDGRRVWLSARSLGLPDGDVENSTHKIKDWMIVRVIDVNAHGSLHCERVSSKATPEELNSYESGQPVKGLVLLADEERGLAIDLEPVVGWVDWAEIPESQHHLAFWNRRIGHTVFGHVATRDAEDGSVAVTLEQASIAAYDLLTKDDVVVGRVTNYLDGDDQGTAVFVGFTPNTVSGLVPSGEIPIRHRDNPRSVYQRGDSVSVAVKRVDREKSRLRFSIVDALLQRNKTLFKVGDVVSCVVSEVTKAGLQVTAKGANGFIRREELTCSVGDVPGDLVREDEQLEAVVIAHESSDGMPALSIRRLAPDWLDRIAELQEGQQVRGVVVASDPEFADVDIGTVTARIRCQEQSLSPDSEMRLKADDEITAVITHISDGGGDKPPEVGLSMRQADPSYADAISEVEDGSIVEGIVARVGRERITVDVGPITGRVPRSELPVAQGTILSSVYKPGDTVRVFVSWVAPDEKRAGLSVGRADPLKYGLTHPEFLDGVSVEARCVEIGDRIAKFEIPGNDLRGVMPADEFSLEVGETEVFKVDDTITAFVRGVDKDNTTVRLSLRRAQDGWSDACAGIKKGEILQGAVVEVAPRGGVREGGVRVDLGPLTEWVAADEVSLDTDAFPNEAYSIGDRVGVYVVDAGNLGEQNPWLELSLRRAMEEWVPHARRISEGSLMTGRVLPVRVLQGRPELLDGVVRIDLGAVNGRVSAQEYDGAAANAYVQANRGGEVSVVVRRFEISDIRAEAEVSIEGYAKRWDELVGALPDHRMITAKCVRRDGTGLDVDLGSGLICLVPASDWAMDAGAAVRSLDSYSFGDSIAVRVAHIDEAEQAIVGTLLTASQQRVANLLQSVESDRVEFKPGLRRLKGIPRDQDEDADGNRNMEFEALKTLAAFLNADGGDLVIGVTDAGVPKGFAHENWKSSDEAQRNLVQNFTNQFPGLQTYLSTEIVPYGGVDLLLASVEPLPLSTEMHAAARLYGKCFVRHGSSSVEYSGEKLMDLSKYFAERRERMVREEEAKHESEDPTLG